MKKWMIPALLTTVFSVLLPGASPSPAPPEYAPDSSNLVYYVPQFSEFESISDQEMLFFKKTLDRAARAHAKAVILEMDTPGGSVETAFKYLSLMERSAIPIIVYLNPNGISAGMIIALGADRIAMSPRGVIGDAMPLQVTPAGVRPVTDKPDDAPAEKKEEQLKKSDPPADSAPALLEKLLEEFRKIRKGQTRNHDDGEEERRLADQKFLTVFFKMLQVMAEKNGRPARVVRAMADPYTTLTAEKDGIEHQKTSPLTLSAQEAHRLKVVDYLVENRADLLRQLNLSNAEVVEIRRTPTEQIGAFLAHPALAGLLLVIGLVGLFIEVKTPGFGVPGVLGVAALTLFFLGHIASGASDWGPMVVFFVGLLLIALEIFVIPGFGLVGVLGIGCTLISFFWAFGFDRIETAVQVVTLAVLTAIAIMVMLAVYVLPHTPLFRKVILEESMNSADGFTALRPDETLIGRRGVTLTPLRPAGTVKLGETRHDAASEGDFLEAGIPVVVTACNGFQLIVRQDDNRSSAPEDSGSAGA